MSSFRRHFINFGNRQSSHPKVPKDVPSSSSSPSNGPMDESPLNQKMAFINDICQCLEFCSSYISALNQLCSSGAVLAQSLTQLFSRDYFQNCVPSGGTMSYYSIAEQFLAFWELVSVSTAGASATVKTETLMTLQDIINKLENDDDNDNSESSLTDCVDAAKCCLQSYVELQSQFSQSSFQCMSQLSQNYSADCVSDIANDIKRHFTNCNVSNNHLMVKSEMTNQLTNQNQSPIKNVSPKVSLNNLTQTTTAKGPSHSLGSIDSNIYGNSLDGDSCVLEDVINLLSYRTTNLQLTNVRNANVNSQIPFQVQCQNVSTVDNYALPLNKCNDLLLKQSNWNGKVTSSFNNWQLWSNVPNEAIENDGLTLWNNVTFGDNCSSGSGSDESGVIGAVDSNANADNNNVLTTMFVDQLLHHHPHNDILKRLSISSDGLEGTLTSIPANAFNSPAFDSPYAMPLDVRIAKTSTWPLKQNSLNAAGILSGDRESHFLLSPDTVNSWSDDGTDTPHVPKYSLFGNTCNRVP